MGNNLKRKIKPKPEQNVETKRAIFRTRSKSEPLMKKSFVRVNDKSSNHELLTLQILESFFYGDAFNPDISNTLYNDNISFIIDSIKRYFNFFLGYVDSFWKLQDIVSSALCRYIQWMLLRRIYNVRLLIPMDIELILYIHMLHPVDYYKFTIWLYQKQMNSYELGITSTFESKELGKQLSDLWNKEYHEDCSMHNSSSKLKYYVNVCSIALKVDFYSSILNQFMFLERLLHHIRTEEDNKTKLLKYTSEQFVTKALNDYRKFLLLKSKNIDIIPNIYISLIWRAHLINPQEYRTDCMEEVGKCVDFIELDEEYESLLMNSSCKIWYETYKEFYTPLSLTGYTRSPSMRLNYI